MSYIKVLISRFGHGGTWLSLLVLLQRWLAVPTIFFSRGLRQGLPTGKPQSSQSVCTPSLKYFCMPVVPKEFLEEIFNLKLKLTAINVWWKALQQRNQGLRVLHRKVEVAKCMACLLETNTMVIELTTFLERSLWFCSGAVLLGIWLVFWALLFCSGLEPWNMVEPRQVKGVQISNSKLLNWPWR